MTTLRELLSVDGVGLPNVARRGLLDMQVCVPKTYTDDDVERFAEEVNRCGTENGWQIRREGDEALAGDPERSQCSDYPGNVHIVLDA